MAWKEMIRLRNDYGVGRNDNIFTGFSDLGLKQVADNGLASGKYDVIDGTYDVIDKKLFFLKVVECGINFVIVE